MFGIAFDMMKRELEVRRPTGVTQVDRDDGALLADYGFDRVQGGVYATANEDISSPYLAIEGLERVNWFPDSLRDIQAFRIDQRSDFTATVKQTDRASKSYDHG